MHRMDPPNPHRESREQTSGARHEVPVGIALVWTPRDADFETRVRASFARLTLMKTIGAHLYRVVPGEVEIALAFRDELTQHHGYIAAAILTAIVDIACGYAAMTLMPAGMSVLTVEYKVNFLAPARAERFVALGHVIRPGRTLTVCSGEVVGTDQDGRQPLATMLGTMIAIPEDRIPNG